MSNGMKQTNIGEIPVEWEMFKLSNLCKVKRGASPRPIKDPLWWGGCVGWVRISDVTSSTKYLNTTTDYLSDEGVKQSIQIPRGEVILTICATIGVPIIINTDACIHDGFVWFDGLSQNIDREYFYYFLLSKRELLASNRQLGTQGNLNTTIVGELYFPFPPLAEQQKIAEILTTVDDKIAVIDEQLAKTNELKTGLMQQLLTKGIGHTEFKDSPLGQIPKKWEVVQLDKLVKKVGSGITPSGGRETYLKKGVLFIRSQNVLSGKLQLDDAAFISHQQHQRMSNSYLSPGDVLLNITGASIGRSAVVPDTILAGNVNQHVCIIRTTSELDAQFLCEFLNSHFGQKQIDMFQAGGNRQGLNFQQIRSFNIPLPLLTEQQQVAEILTTVDDKVQVLRDKKEHYQTLKRGLMQQLLTGKLRVHVTEDVVLA